MCWEVRGGSRLGVTLETFDVIALESGEGRCHHCGNVSSVTEEAGDALGAGQITALLQTMRDSLGTYKDASLR